MGDPGFPLAASVVAVFEHVVTGRIECPKGAFARPAFLARYFDETVVQTQIVSDGVLPSLAVLAVVREPLHDELVDAVERDLVVVGRLDGHGDQGDVGVGRLLRHGADRWDQFQRRIDSSAAGRSGRPQVAAEVATVAGQLWLMRWRNPASGTGAGRVARQPKVVQERLLRSAGRNVHHDARPTSE